MPGPFPAPPNPPRRRRLRRAPAWLAVAGLLAALAVTVGLPASADLNRTAFELDDNAVTNAAGVQPRADDWSDVYSQITADADDVGSDDTCAALGAVECAFVSDPQGPDGSIFTTGGSKDDLPVSRWRWTTGSVPDADEILDAYAIKYASGGQQNLYFGADRYAVNGSKDFGFWFFHAPVTLNSNGTFNGAHQGDLAPGDDDILILGTFTQGGATATVRIFRWVGTGGNATADETVDGPVGSFGDCLPAVAADDGCATVNGANIPTGGWAFVGKQNVGANMIATGGFVEGGINLTDLGLDGCFSSFIAETRSSPSVDATLKDFVLGQFEACGSTTTTTPKAVSGTTGSLSYANIPAAGAQIGTGGALRVADEASVVVNGTQSFGGSVSFRLCGPTPLADANFTLCTASTGTAIGAAKTVSGPSPSVVQSDEATVTSAGRYCWYAAYSGDVAAGVPGSTDSSVTECFKVLPEQPTLTTVASNNTPGTAAPFGTSIDDTATLAGTAKQPGSPVIDPTTPGGNADGTITFKLYGPSETAVCTDPDPAANPPVAGNRIATSVVNVDGDSTSYQASTGTITGSLTPTAPGTYYWRAEYSGDAPNTLAVALTACGETNESSYVQQAPSAISTSQSVFPNDSATVSTASGDLTGSVQFKLYTEAGGATALANCQANGAQGLVFSQTRTIGASAGTEETLSTSNGDPNDAVVDYSATTSNSYYWHVTFTSGDQAVAGRQSACAENTAVTFTNDAGPGTTLP